MKRGKNNSAWLLESDKEAEAGQVGDSGEKGTFGTTSLHFAFHLSPYQSSRAASSNAPEGIQASHPTFKKKGQCSGQTA